MKLPLWEGALEVLQALHKKYKLLLMTAGWQAQILPFLEYHDIKQYFSYCTFADDDTSKHKRFVAMLERNNAPPSDYIFVTDTLGDLKEAQTLSIPTIAVTFGYHPKERLQKGNPTYLAHSWSDIETAIENHFSLK